MEDFAVIIVESLKLITEEKRIKEAKIKEAKELEKAKKLAEKEKNNQ